MAWETFIPAGFELGKRLGKYLVGRKKKRRYPKWDETAYAKFLKRGATEGVYSPKAERTILGKVGRQTGMVAQAARTRLGGLLESRIGRRSIAGIKTMGEPERVRIGKMGDIAREIAIENELSKIGYGKRYAIGKTESEFREVGEEREELAEKKFRLGELISGVGQAGMLGYRGFRRKKYAEEYPQEAKYAEAAEAEVPLPRILSREEKSFEEKLQEMANVLKMLGLID